MLPDRSITECREYLRRCSIERGGAWLRERAEPAAVAYHIQREHRGIGAGIAAETDSAVKIAESKGAYGVLRVLENSIFFRYEFSVFSHFRITPLPAEKREPSVFLMFFS